jgi:hypothetical protein
MEAKQMFDPSKPIVTLSDAAAAQARHLIARLPIGHSWSSHRHQDGRLFRPAI